jgi:hypothetical protein
MSEYNDRLRLLEIECVCEIPIVSLKISWNAIMPLYEKYTTTVVVLTAFLVGTKPWID